MNDHVPSQCITEPTILVQVQSSSDENYGLEDPDWWIDFRITVLRQTTFRLGGCEERF